MLRWNDLFLQGSIINLSVSRWRANMRLLPEDLGLTNDQAKTLKRGVSLGVIRLASKEISVPPLSMERKAKDIIDMNSIAFPMIKGARFVPEDKIQAVLDQLDQVKRDFAERVSALVDPANFEEMKTEAMPIIKKSINELVKTPEHAESAYERVLRQYPTAGQVRQKFAMTWSVYSLSGTNGNDELLKGEAESVRGVVKNMIQKLRTEIKEKLTTIMDIAASGGKLTDRSIASAEAVLDRIDQMNFLGDPTLTAQIRSMRSILKNVRTAEGKVGTTSIDGLNGIKKELDKSVEDAVRAAEEKLTGMGRRKLS